MPISRPPVCGKQRKRPRQTMSSPARLRSSQPEFLPLTEKCRRCAADKKGLSPKEESFFRNIGCLNICFSTATDSIPSPEEYQCRIGVSGQARS